MNTCWLCGRVVNDYIVTKRGRVGCRLCYPSDYGVGDVSSSTRTDKFVESGTTKLKKRLSSAP